MTSSSSSSPEILSAQTADSQDRFSYKHATHDEVLEDLSSRFILNLPDEELASLERICFQVEQAHWFYEDFIREENPKFPSLPLKKFSAMLFHACPLLHQWSHDHEQAFNTFMQYKTRVPVCGAIMLNDTWEKCILVKGWKSSSGWGFPKGKINEDEAPHNCAIREVLEETGYNLAGQIDPEDVIEMSIKEQKISLYIVPGVPEDFPFKTRTRKEISRIEWFRLTDLPTWKRNKIAPGKFYLISPFIGALRNFINERRPRPPPRKGAKVKNVQVTQDIHLRNEADNALTLKSLSTYHDASTQESSSQSSSADNGGPQTPSPQYTEPIVNPINGRVATAAAEDDVSKALSTHAIDPHFARLLNSLSLSATVGGDSKDQSKSLLTPISLSSRENTSPSFTTPGPVVGSPIESHLRPESTHQPDWSTHAPSRLSERTSEAPFSCPPSDFVSSSTGSGPQPRNSTRSFPRSSTLSLSSHSTGTTTPSGPYQLPQPPLSAALSSASVSTTSGASSTFSGPRKSSSRRSSSTADISPYLSRSSEVPTSGKRLKQLALLESVADESARMSPSLGSREPPFHANGFSMAYTGKHSYAPGPPASVPPPSAITHSGLNDFGLIYSSSPGPVGSPFPPPYNARPPLPQGVYDDPFQVRPRTSHTFHPFAPSCPPHTGRGSMNQSQLLSLLNGPPGQGSHTQPGVLPPPPPPPHLQGPYRHAFPPPPIVGRHPQQLSLHHHTRPGLGPLPLHVIPPHLLPSPQSTSGPLSAPALSPAFSLPPAAATNHSNLLSILNGKGATASLTGNASMMSSGVVNSLGHR